MADSDKLALGLDEIIRLNGSNRRGGSGGGGRGNRGFRARSGRGGGNKFQARGGGGIPRSSNQSAGGRWKHDLYENNNSIQNRVGQRNTGVTSTTKLLISNLDFGVTTTDIEELFADVGAIRTARVHYDESGRSLGTAEVIFERRVDAVNAQQKYNTLNLDGRPMDIRLVGGVDDGSKPQSNRFQSNGNSGRNQRFGNRNTNQQNGNRTRGGRQQNATNGKKEEVTADDLDAELDAYRAESKQKK